MSQFKLVILDNAIKQLNNPLAQRLLNDLLLARQKNFARTDENYIVLDKHDMIATHALIFDTTNIYSPELIFAMRITFQSRAQVHKVKTPIQDLSATLPIDCQNEIKKHIAEKNNLIEINSLFVDERYTHKNTGLRLPDIGFTAAYLQIARMGYNHFACCPNAKYKAHRLVDPVAQIDYSFDFVHPVVTDPHKLILVNQFKKEYLAEVYKENQSLFDQALEVSPTDHNMRSVQETLQDEFILGFNFKQTGLTASKVAS